MVTAAPEVGNVAASIPELTERDIIVSLGHFEATYEEACGAVEADTSMVTHLFNAMQPLHHRQPGIIGLLGNSDQTKRPYVGVIADGIHLHPTVVNLAYRTNPEGFILVMDAMHLQWSNDGGRLVKKGTILTVEGTPDKIAGSSITLLQCVNNFLSWSNVAVPVALKAVTDTPAKMLGLHDVKGTLSPGADADLVVLDEVKHSNLSELVLEQTWKFGVKVYDEHEC
ncbi:hypothetical protein EDD37DRAFT_678008 [Exophiala viscosa]|uniref:uncharacterized protein n=1 Tax=Exophiala viscosa TaxID=2486360 RepID=UPI00219A2C2E|nr:hypothetical protein EDD37DRAFT_678008 [Exophiala viscosa]